MTRPALALALAACAAALLACRGSPPAPPPDQYTVRGELVRVSDEPDGRQLWIRHEAVPEFRDRSGARVGMASMLMPFRAGPAVAGLPLSPGDKLRFRFSVDWERGRSEVEAVERLAPGTALALGKR